MHLRDLEDWREKMTLSKSDAAKTLGLSRQHYSQITSGARDIPHWMPLACAALYHRIKPWPICQ